MQFLKETDLDKVKHMAIGFLHLPIKETNLSLLFIQHPFWDSPFMSFNGSIVNIINDEVAYNEIINNIEKNIQACSTVSNVLALIRKPYKLAFLKYTKSCMSREDFSKILRKVWIISDNPNQDPNVSIHVLTRWFRQADKRCLMSAREYDLFIQFPDYTKLYRGVSPGREHDGLSWTTSYEIAEWFSHRFETKTTRGYMREGIINKRDILAVFDDDNESEIVIDVKKLTVL